MPVGGSINVKDSIFSFYVITYDGNKAYTGNNGGWVTTYTATTAGYFKLSVRITATPTSSISAYTDNAQDHFKVATNGLLNNVFNLDDTIAAIKTLTGFGTGYNIIKSYSSALGVSNYSAILPDANNAKVNTAYRLIFSSSGACPANLPKSTWDDTWDVSTLITIANADSQFSGAIQILVTAVNVYYRVYRSSAWQNWIDFISLAKASNINRFFVVDKSGSGDYTSFSRAVIDSYITYPNATLLVKQGTYDIYQEMLDIYGSNYWDTLTADDAGLAKYYMGLPFGSGVKIIGTPGAEIVFNNISENTVVSTWFSGLYGMHNFNYIYQGGTVKNLKFTCTKGRYCIHLDFGSSPRNDYYKVKNNELNLDNSANTERDNAYALGMGGGVYTTYDIEDNYINPVFPSNARDYAGIYYHNSSADSPKNRCNIVGNYVDNGGTIRTDPNGTSSNNCKVFISNNNVGSAMLLNGNTGTNLKIVDWNNVVRA